MPIRHRTVMRPLKRRLQTAMIAAGMALTLLGPAHADELADISRLIKSGRHAEALTRTEAVLAQQPRDPQMRFTKGVILTEMDKQQDAIAVFTRLSEDYPNLPEPFNNLAVLYAAQGQYEKARAALDKAIRTNPSYATAYENLGDVHARLASEAYGKALQIDAGNVNAKAKLTLVRDLALATSQPVRSPTDAAPGAGAAVASAPVRPVASAASAPTTAQSAGKSAPARSPSVATASSTTAPSAAVTVPSAAATAPSAAATAPGAPATASTAPATASTAPATAASSARSSSAPSKPPATASSSTASTAPAAASSSTASKTPTPAADIAAAERAAVMAAVESWAKAWSARDVNAYLNHYASDFDTPGNQSRKAWVEERTARIVDKRRISVKIRSPKVSISDGKATVKFRQSYVSDRFSSSTSKTLLLVKQRGQWLIQKESTGS